MATPVNMRGRFTPRLNHAPLVSFTLSDSRYSRLASERSPSSRDRVPESTSSSARERVGSDEESAAEEVVAYPGVVPWSDMSCI